MVEITFVNGSISLIETDDPRKYARENISYSGGRVREVKIIDPIIRYSETVWRSDWDTVSQWHGLND